MSIKDLPVNLRPREKAFLQGLESLNDIELLALFLASGTKNKDALQIAQTLFKKFQSFKNIANASFKELKQMEGIGNIKALFIKSLGELNKRIVNSTYNHKELIGIKTIIDKSFDLIASKTQEAFLMFFLDNKNKVISYKVLYQGTRWNLAVEPNEIIKEVLKQDAYHFYCFHNHPSGIVTPSVEDVKTSRTIDNYAKLFGIKMLGHYIVNQKRNYHQIKW